MPKLTKSYGHLAILGANLIFGFNASFSKAVLLEMDPHLLTLFRVMGACILFWSVSLFTKKERISWRDLLLMLGASLFGIVINQFCYLEGLSRTGVINSATISTQTPIITMLLAAIILREPITWKKAIGVFIGMCGALLLVLQNGLDFRGAELDGMLFCFTSSISFALYLTLFRHLIERHSPITLMKWMFLYASIIGSVVYHKELISFNPTAISPQLWWRIAYVVVAATFIAYILIPISQRVLRPTTISMYSYLQPIIATLSAIAMGLDVLNFSKIIAICLVFIGVYMVTMSKSKQQLEAERALHHHNE